jgi:hypothetical protein
MGTRAFPLAPALLTAMALSAQLPEGAAAQSSSECGAPLSSVPIDHSSETAVFTGVDHDNRAFTLTRNPDTGAWALWVISEFTEQTGGLEVGIPCIVVAGSQSQLMASSPPAIADASIPAVGSAEVVAAAAAPAEEVETFRVSGVDDGEVLDLRTGAGTDFPSIAEMPPDAAGITVGSCKDVDGYNYPWCEAAWQGNEGWASACCLEGEKTGRRLDE